MVRHIGTLTTLRSDLHIYREGYADRWAIVVPGDRFTDLADQWQTYQGFLEYCNIVKPPNIERGLAL